jgi:hypothetical protein
MFMLRCITAAALFTTVGCQSAKPNGAPRSPAFAGSLHLGPTKPKAPAASWDQPVAQLPTKAATAAQNPREIAEKALLRIPQIKQRLTSLRALPFKSDVPAQYQDNAAFRAFVDAELQKELPPEKSQAMTAAMLHIGLLKEPIDIGQAMADAMVTQAAAYYDPNQKKFFMVMAPDDKNTLDMFSAHELTHALQDQHFDLNRYLEPNGKKGPALNDDQANARKFIVEGEATFVMLAYLLAQGANQQEITPRMLTTLNMQLRLSSNISLADMRGMMKAQASSISGDPSMKAAGEAMDKLPAIVMVPMIDSYMKGAVPVAAAFEKGGWPEVAKFYSDPPQSTEQLLHPTTKLFPTRDLPTQVTVPSFIGNKDAGIKKIEINTIGELGWRIYLEQWNIPSFADAAAGWDGDSFTVWSSSDGKLHGAIATIWDTDQDATEFATAFRTATVSRFGKDGATRTDGTTVTIAQVGTKVFIVDGAPDVATAAKWMAQLKKDAVFK